MYDADAQKVSLRAVELGPYREDGVVITRGLSHGEWIVAAGVHKLQPGPDGEAVRGARQAGPSRRRRRDGARRPRRDRPLRVRDVRSEPELMP